MYLFLDVDGTIINYHAETPVSALEALNKAQQYITDDVDADADGLYNAFQHFGLLGE